MKHIVPETLYTFSAAGKTITFDNNYAGLIEQQNILLVVRLVSGTIIYQFNKGGTKGGTLAGLVLTLEWDTTTYNDADQLFIILEAPAFDGLTLAQLLANSVTVNINQSVFKLLGSQVTNADKGLVTHAVLHGSPDAGATFYDAVVDSTGKLKVVMDALPAGAALDDTLQSILAKILVAPSTEAKQDTTITALGTLLTELQLKANLTETQPVSASSLPLPTGASTEATLALVLAALTGLSTETTLAAIAAKDFATETTLLAIAAILNNINTAQSDGTQKIEVTNFTSIDFATETTLATLAGKDFATQTTLAAILAKIIAAPATEAKQDTIITDIGATNETAPVTDTADSGLNGRLQRIAQRITSLIALLPAALGAGGGLKIDGSGTALPVSLSGVSTEATLATRLSESTFDTKVGSLTETAPATDTASSGLNGRLQRIAQRITSLIALFPTALGQTTKANSFPVTLANDQKYQPVYGGNATALTITNLNSLANSATAGWQSARISNLSTLATDYEIGIKLTMANTAPANDKSVYVYICPFFTDDSGSTWYAASGGTTTLPSGSEGTYTIATPNNLRLLGVLNYTTQNMVLQDSFFLSNAFGNRMPSGFSIIIINYTGAAIAASTNHVKYVAINDGFK